MPKLKLRKYQSEGVRLLQKLLLSNKRAGLFDDPGTGKTIQALALWRVLPPIKSMLVICPAGTKINWGREAEKWGVPEEFRIESYNFLQYEDKAELLDRKWDLVVADECQYMKNMFSKTTQNFLNYVYKNAKYYLPMSGTPATRSAEDYFPLLSMLEPGKWGSYGDFRRRHCLHRTVFNREFWYGFKNMGRIEKALKRLGVSRTADEVVKDLPPVSQYPLYVEVDKKSLAKDLGVSKKALEYQGNLDQELRDPPPHLVTHLKTLGKYKAEACEDWLRGRLAPSLIFYQHTDVRLELESILDKHRTYGVIKGGQTPKGKQRSIDDFQNGVVDVLLIQMQAGGVGLNLQRASEIVFIERPWNPADYDQCCKRAHRIGQENPVSIYNVVAVNTVDELIDKSMSKKRSGLIS